MTAEPLELERSEHPRITLNFIIEKRGEQLFFRAAHTPDAAWHGPYDEDALLETISHYVEREVIETWFIEGSVS